MKQHKYMMPVLAMLLTTLLPSCKKFLDQKPNHALSVPATLTEARDLLNNYVVMNCQTPDMSMESDDDFYMTDALFNTSNESVKAAYCWKKDLVTDLAWENMYKVVLTANMALELTRQIAPTVQNQVEWNTVKGMALFHRSHAFYQLAQCYAKPYDQVTAVAEPGIPLRLASDLNIPTIRSTLQETYDQIINDLKQAVPLLQVTTMPVSIPSKAAAYAMLARISHAMENYEDALRYADSCLQLNAGLTNYNTVSASAVAPFQQFNTEVIFASTLAGLSRFSVNNLLVDSNLFQSYHGNDLRRSLFFKNLSPQVGFGFKGNYEGNTYGQLFTGLAVDEMYLIKAECQARLIGFAAAMDTLNAFLVTRWRTGTFTPFAAATDQQALDIILVERRKQLIGRGLRWHDLRRYNQHSSTAVTLMRLVNGNTFELAPAHPNYTFYIPQIVIDQSGIPQNIRQ